MGTYDERTTDVHQLRSRNTRHNRHTRHTRSTLICVEANTNCITRNNYFAVALWAIAPGLDIILDWQPISKIATRLCRILTNTPWSD